MFFFLVIDFEQRETPTWAEGSKVEKNAVLMGSHFVLFTLLELSLVAGELIHAKT